MINVFEPRLSVKDKISVLKTLNKNNISGTSPTVNEFEKACAEKFGRKYGIAVSNGSVALDVAFQMLDLNEDDEVILPSFAIISCLSAVLRTKAKPIFCDVDENTWNMSFENVKAKITKKTKAVLIVHLYGLTADAIKISNYCSENNIFLVEDAAEAHGQVIENKKCGSFGQISTMSFYANKHVTTGEGGIILTDSDKFYEQARLIRNLDFDNSKRFQHNNLYWNYRLGGIQAALGLSQLKNIDSVISEKINQGKYYTQLLGGLNKYIQLPPVSFDDIQNHYWVYGLVINQDGIRSRVVAQLEENGIQTRPFFWPLHLQPAFKESKNFYKDKLPISEKIGKNGLYIPIGKHINKNDQKFISNKLIQIITSFN